MAIFGNIVLEDLSISFYQAQPPEDLMMMVKVIQETTGQVEHYCTPQAKFFKALSIAMHNDGTPNWETDYPDAEEAQPKNPLLRFIP